jgi:hypothetical protein
MADSHLNPDDLFAPLPETVRLGGHGPFVINLSASGSPLAIPASPVQGCTQAHVYRVQRIEDGRARYRLRFGPFATEDEADAILKIVRENYPSSLTATADAEDLRAIAAIQSKMPAVPPVAKKPATAATARPAASMPAAVKPAVAKPPTTPPAAIKPAVAKPPTTPPAAIKPAVAKPPTTPPAAIKPAVAKPPTTPLAPIKPAVAKPAAGPDTDAVRALKLLELDEDKDWRWYVVQLSLAEEPPDPATVPNLDIFGVYRLYCVAGIVDGRILHALRVGFFAEQPAADAVAGYLAAFYDRPVIKRVNAAERERFAGKPLEPRKDVGTTGKQAVIEITNERFVRAAPSGHKALK